MRSGHDFFQFPRPAGDVIEDVNVRPNSAAGLGEDDEPRIDPHAPATRFRSAASNDRPRWNKPSIDFYESLGAVPMDELITMRLDRRRSSGWPESSETE